MDSKPIAILVPQDAQSLDISGPLDAFLEANRQAPRQMQLRRALIVNRPRSHRKGRGHVARDR
jgi:hypothetical protein